MRALPWVASICSLFILLSGCATKNSVLGAQGSLGEAGTGYVALSMVHEVDASTPGSVLLYPAIQAHFYAAGTTGKVAFAPNTSTDGTVTGLWNDPGASLDERRGKRIMTLLKVAPGRYQLGRITAVYVTTNQSAHLDLTAPPEIEVRAGEITYAGSIHYSVKLATTIFGQTKPTGANLRLLDEFAKDMPAMKHADARLAALPFVDGLPPKLAAEKQTEMADAPEAPQRVAPPSPVASPAPLLAQSWTGSMRCSARHDRGLNAAAFEEALTMDVKGGNATIQLRTAEVDESFTGAAAGGMLQLRGKGYRIKDSARAWDYVLSGEFAPDARSFSGKGRMLAGGAPIRSCELHMTRL